MNTNAGGAANFFTGPYHADYRVQQVLSRAEEDFYKERERQNQVEEYYRRQAEQDKNQMQLQQQIVCDNNDLMIQQRKEQEQAGLLDKQM